MVRAGLIPRLRAGAVPGSERWLIAEMVPGAHPLVELEGALLRLGSGGPSTLLDVLRADELGLLRATKQVLPPSGELVLVIDQLEEVFRLVGDEQERTLFLAGIAGSLGFRTRPCGSWPPSARTSTIVRSCIRASRTDAFVHRTRRPARPDARAGDRGAGPTRRRRSRARLARRDAVGDLINQAAFHCSSTP